MSEPERSLDAIYDDLWHVAALEQWAATQEDLRPRPPDHLLDLVADIGLGPASSVLDVGCGRGDHACELARRFGARIMAIDPVESNVENTRQLVRRMNLGSRVQAQGGLVERLGFGDGAFDLIWCRSVIVHLAALSPAFRECRRVLAPGGFMMLQTGFATESLEPREAALLRRRLGFFEDSMRRPHVEEALRDAGFTVVRSEVYGSEFAESYEADEGRCAHHLMGIARLLRAETALVDRFGRAYYETALGMYHWQVYQMLGKVSYHAYLLQPGE